MRGVSGELVQMSEFILYIETADTAEEFSFRIF